MADMVSWSVKQQAAGLGLKSRFADAEAPWYQPCLSHAELFCEMVNLKTVYTVVFLEMYAF